MRFFAIFTLAQLVAMPLAAGEITTTFNDTELRYEGEAVTQCMIFEQGGLYFISVEAGEDDGPGIQLDYSGDSLGTVTFELRTEPGWAYWTASNSPLYNNHAGGAPVESHITLREEAGEDGTLVLDARMIFAGGDAHAEANAVISLSCD